MVNCAHPSHFKTSFSTDAAWVERVRGILANASAKSHAELDEATELDPGDPRELGRLYAELKCSLPHLNVFGGCCGTDHHHMREIFRAIAPHHPKMNPDACEEHGITLH
jgi:homocysteine S-methyltransferase